MIYIADEKQNPATEFPVETVTPKPTYPAPESKKEEVRRRSVEAYGKHSPFHPENEFYNPNRK